MSYRDPEEKRAYERQWRKRKYAEDPEYKARKRATDNAWRRNLRQEIAALKLVRGCCRCEYSKCSSALQFHHRDPTGKLFNVGAYLGLGRKAIYEEIEKCDVLCSNCHAELHCPSSC